MANQEDSFKKSSSANVLLNREADLDRNNAIQSDDRLKKSSGSGREDRAIEDQSIAGAREISDDDRMEIFRNTFSNASLPNLPKIPGYHIMWATTTNPRDTILMRKRLGYEPVTVADVPGWESLTVQTGEYLGFIAVNEMIAMKIPLRLYEKYMQHAHHDAPTGQIEAVTAEADRLRGTVEGAGGRLIEGDGMIQLRKKRGHAQFNLND